MNMQTVWSVWATNNLLPTKCTKSRDHLDLFQTINKQFSLYVCPLESCMWTKVSICMTEVVMDIQDD
jgi:hypothetical protein